MCMHVEEMQHGQPLSAATKAVDISTESTSESFVVVTRQRHGNNSCGLFLCLSQPNKQKYVELRTYVNVRIRYL